MIYDDVITIVSLGPDYADISVPHFTFWRAKGHIAVLGVEAFHELRAEQWTSFGLDAAETIRDYIRHQATINPSSLVEGVGLIPLEENVGPIKYKLNAAQAKSAWETTYPGVEYIKSISEWQRLSRQRQHLPPAP